MNWTIPLCAQKMKFCNTAAEQRTTTTLLRILTFDKALLCLEARQPSQTKLPEHCLLKDEATQTEEEGEEEGDEEILGERGGRGEHRGQHRLCLSVNKHCSCHTQQSRRAQRTKKIAVCGQVDDMSDKINA